MADELLSIEESTLNAIADAIRSKGGTSAALSFPNGMVSALQAIETESTVTPKITPQQVTLTPSNTSFAIAAGFHDGTGTVAIQLDTTNNSANPTTTQQTYYPTSGKFFGSFAVGGTGAGVIVATGEITLSGSRTASISGLNFTPEGIILALKTPNLVPTEYGSTYTYTGSVWTADFGYKRSLPYAYNGTANFTGGVELVNQISRSYGSISFGVASNHSYFNGTYYYMVWGS